MMDDNTKELIEKLEEKMVNHDWWYIYSKDSNIQTKAKKLFNEIIFDLDVLSYTNRFQAKRLWDKYSPIDFNMPIFLRPPQPLLNIISVEISLEIKKLIEECQDRTILIDKANSFYSEIVILQEKLLSISPYLAMAVKELKDENCLKKLYRFLLNKRSNYQIIMEKIDEINYQISQLEANKNYVLSKLEML